MATSGSGSRAALSTGDFLAAVGQALEHDGLISLTLSQPIEGGKTSPPASTDAVKTTLRPVSIGGQRLVQWTLHHRQQRHTNRSTEETRQHLQRLLEESPTFGQANAFLTDADWAWQRNRRGRVSVQRGPATKTPQPLEHDRTKRRLLVEGTPLPFAVEAGLMLPDGRIPKAKRAKWRQLARFLELVDDVLGDLPSEADLAADGGRPLQVVEFGSGQSHLSLALRHLIATLRGRAVRIRAIDRDPAVIATARERIERLGWSDVTCEVASIETVTLSPPVDLAIWLHACDTATDDALAASVRAGVAVILAVPCCQHEVNTAMQQAAREPGGDPLAAFGLLRERYAALATDALRANWLQQHGYRTQVVEFIDLEHTAKNVLLRAVRQSQPVPATRREQLQQDASVLKQRLGLDSWHLERVAANDSN